MPPLAIVPADVQHGANVTLFTALASEVVEAGESVRFGLTGRLERADASVSGIVGVALDNAIAGQPLTVGTSGNVRLGTGIVVPGEFYVAGPGPGEITPTGDLATGWVNLIGFGFDVDTLRIDMIATGVVRW